MHAASYVSNLGVRCYVCTLCGGAYGTCTSVTLGSATYRCAAGPIAAGPTTFAVELSLNGADWMAANSSLAVLGKPYGLVVGGVNSSAQFTFAAVPAASLGFSALMAQLVDVNNASVFNTADAAGQLTLSGVLAAPSTAAAQALTLSASSLSFAGGIVSPFTPALSAAPTVGTYVLTFSALSSSNVPLARAATLSFVVVPGPAVALAVSPADPTSGVAVSVAAAASISVGYVLVRTVDVAGNYLGATDTSPANVTVAAAQLNLALGTVLANSGALLAGTTTRASAAGKAEFTDLALVPYTPTGARFFNNDTLTYAPASVGKFRLTYSATLASGSAVSVSHTVNVVRCCRRRGLLRRV